MAGAAVRDSTSIDLRIGLACKILDMASVFEIRTFDRSELPSPLANDAWFDPVQRSPTKWLATPRSDPEDLLTSAVRFQVSDGHVLAQAALSNYFDGLALVADGTRVASDLSLPVRRFDPSALVTSDGASAIARMMKRCNFLIIEDADLRPAELLEHILRFGLNDIHAEDMTTAMRLAGNYAYVISNARAGSSPHLGGRPID